MDQILKTVIEEVFANVFEADNLPAAMIRQAIKDGSLEAGHFLDPWKEKVDGLIRRCEEERSIQRDT